MVWHVYTLISVRDQSSSVPSTSQRSHSPEYWSAPVPNQHRHFPAHKIHLTTALQRQASNRTDHLPAYLHTPFQVRGEKYTYLKIVKFCVSVDLLPDPLYDPWSDLPAPVYPQTLFPSKLSVPVREKDQVLMTFVHYDTMYCIADTNLLTSNASGERYQLCHRFT